MGLNEHENDKNEKEEIKSKDDEKVNIKNLNRSVKGKKNYYIEDDDILSKEDVKNKKQPKTNKEKKIKFNTNEEIKSYNSKSIQESEISPHKSILKNK